MSRLLCVHLGGLIWLQSFTFIHTQNHFVCSNENTLKFSVRLHSSGRLDSKWACREVFVQSELVWLAHFISVITNMRHKEKILRSSNFLPPHETQIFLLLSDKYDKTSWLCWPDPIFKIVLNKKIRYFACSLGCGCGPTSVRVCPRVHACRVNQVRL